MRPHRLAALAAAVLVLTGLGGAAPPPERKPPRDGAPPAAEAPASVEAPRVAVPPPLRKPARPGPFHPSEVATEDWTEEEIAEALSLCAMLMREHAVEYEPLPPLREGRCGTPAPVRVTAIGAGPAVAIAPGAVMSCPLAAALARWIRASVQPAALEHLGAPVVGFRNVAAYHCRNRYGARDAPISEHALANALDIAAMETEAGDTVSVLHWHEREPPPPTPPPPPERAPGEVASDSEKRALEVAVEKDYAALAPRRQPTADAARGRSGSRPPAVDLADRAVARARADRDDEPDAAAAPPTRHTPRALFLRRVHAEACDSFGTVLGPEANAAHADHFHLDMAKRRHRGYCQ